MARPRPDSLAVGAVLTVLIALGQISTAVYLPSMPALGIDLGVPEHTVNLTLTLFLGSFAVSQLVYGPLSDRFGRRRVLFAGLAVFTAASLACALAETAEALIVARMVQAFGACAGPVLGRAVVRDVWGPERAATALAYIGIAFSVSPAVVPLLGGYLQIWFGWRANFLFLLGTGVVVGVAAWALLAETGRPSTAAPLRPRALLAVYWQVMRDPAFAAHTLAVALVFAALMGFTAAAPYLFMERLGLSPDAFGRVAFVTAGGFLAGNLIAGRYAARLGVDTMVVIGLGIAALAGAFLVAGALSGWTTVAAVLVPLMLFLAGFGIVMPNGMAGAMAPFPRAAGAASALLGFFQLAGGAAGSMVAGLLEHGSQMPLGVILVAVDGAALAGFLALLRARRETVSG